MGNLVRLTPRPTKTRPKKVTAFAPINYRPPEDCVLMIFPEGSRERALYHYDGIQYCRGERRGDWFYVIEDPETGERGMYWVTFLPDGYELRDYMGTPTRAKYAEGELKIIGRAFQFSFDLNSDERIEIVRGESAASHEENIYARPILNLQTG